MVKEQTTLDIINYESPEMEYAFGNLMKSLIRLRVMNPKTKQLIYIGMKSALGDESAVRKCVPIAKKLGATKEEIEETILLTHAVSGLKCGASCLEIALQIYDESL